MSGANRLKRGMCDMEEIMAKIGDDLGFAIGGLLRRRILRQ